METSLRGRSGGHIGTAPTVSFGQIARVNGWFRLGGLCVGGWYCWGKLCVNGYFVCVGLREKI